MKPQRPPGCQGCLARGVRGAGSGGGAAGERPDRQHASEGPSLGGRGKGGSRAGDRQQLRRSQHQACPEPVEGIHAVTNRYGRPLAFPLTPGQAADCRAAEHLLADLPERCIVHADAPQPAPAKVGNTSRVRHPIGSQGAVPNISPKRTRLWPSCGGCGSQLYLEPQNSQALPPKNT